MRKLLSSAAVAGFLFWTAAPATAMPIEADRLPFTPVPATQVWATRQASAQPGQQPQFLRLDVEQLTPRVITGDSPANVSITGKVVNIGDRRIDNVVLRLERGEALSSEDDVRKALREPTDAEVVQPKFTEITKALQPGESKDFSLEVPLRGPDPTSLALDEPGIYPILANVNGKPDFGGQARLAALSTLLPVLGLPGGATQSKPAAPAKITMLWPLADRPRLVRQGGEGQSELVDDDLTGSLSVNGRLYNLLQAYESAVGTMSTSLCLAIDPDLLRTVEAMSTGYRIRGGGEGKGKDEATLWLERLRLATPGRCVISLPDADADLVALSRAKLGDLTKIALNGAEVVRDVLAPVQPLPNLVWPEDGVVDQQTYEALVAQGVKSLVLDSSGVSDAPGTGPVKLGTEQPVTVTRLDAMVSDALQGGVDRSRTLGGVTTPVESQPVSVQNAVAALVFRAGFQGEGRNVVIAPPRRWNAPVSEMSVFLSTVQKLLNSGYGVQAGLGEPTSAPAAGGKINYPVEAGAREISPSVTATVSRQWTTLAGLSAVMRQEDNETSTPGDLIAPLQLDLLRSMSGAWRSNEAGARSAADVSAEEINALQEQVTVTPPNSPILLGSGDSPIPVTITNKLDVRITVRIVVADTPGIRPRELAEQILPARGERLVRVPVDVLRSGRFSVNVRLTTPDGVALGDTVKLEVSSSAYGTITVVITATAAIALVLLSGRRIYRRVRAARESGEAPEAENLLAENVTPEKSSTS